MPLPAKGRVPGGRLLQPIRTGCILQSITLTVVFCHVVESLIAALGETTRQWRLQRTLPQRTWSFKKRLSSKQLSEPQICYEEGIVVAKAIWERKWCSSVMMGIGRG